MSLTWSKNSKEVSVPGVVVGGEVGGIGDEICAAKQLQSLGISDPRQCFPQHCLWNISTEPPRPLGIVPLLVPLSVTLGFLPHSLKLDFWSPLHPNPVITQSDFSGNGDRHSSLPLD